MTPSKMVEKFAEAGLEKYQTLSRFPLRFLISGLMAGGYIGIGILLILSLGSVVDPALRPLVMGMSFGIALTLIVFAGAELFTGHTMYMSLAVLQRLTGFKQLLWVWVAGWNSNLLGSFLVALLFALGGAGLIGKTDGELLLSIASYKMNSPIIELVARGILCNWLVCLALWMAGRTENDVAKCILIFWCLYAFIASGFEHSVANMTIFSLALLLPHPETITLYGMYYNLFWVSIGNIIAGALIMGVGYWLVAAPEDQITRTNTHSKSPKS